MRVSIFSNSPWAGSGYGTQTKQLAPRIAALGHEVSLTAFYGLEGGVLDWNGIPVYPKGSAPGPHGIDVTAMAQNARHFKADLIISLLDVWVMPPGVGQEIAYCPWYPIDSEPLPPPIKRSLQGTLMPLVFSRFGERMMREAGLDCRYIPHGIDTATTWVPVPRAEARSRTGLPVEAFVVGMVAANKGMPCRKAIKQQIEAFSRLHKKHPDTLLYLHTLMQPADGENLIEMCEQVGLTDSSVIFSDPYLYQLGYPEQQVRDLYCSFDVLTNVAMGEGFGLTPLEAQACGTPVISGAWTAMEELNFGGWLVPKTGAEKWHTPLGAYQFWPRVDAIYEQMEAAYLATDRAERGERARQAAETYDADTIVRDFWAPALVELEQLIANRKPRSFADYLTALPPGEAARASA